MGAKGVVCSRFSFLFLSFLLSLSLALSLFAYLTLLVEWNSCPDTISIAERSGKYSFAMRLQTNTQRRRVSARFANHLGENVFCENDEEIAHCFHCGRGSVISSRWLLVECCSSVHCACQQIFFSFFCPMCLCVWFTYTICSSNANLDPHEAPSQHKYIKQWDRAKRVFGERENAQQTFHGWMQSSDRKRPQCNNGEWFFMNRSYF